MKSLRDFIVEKMVVEVNDTTKTIAFNFDGIDNCEETLKSLEGYDDYISIDDNTVTVTISEKTFAKIAPVKDILEQAIKAERNGSRSTNDEQYAQKVKKLETRLSELNEVIDSFMNDDSKEETPDAKDAAENDKKKADSKKGDEEKDDN